MLLITLYIYTTHLNDNTQYSKFTVYADPRCPILSMSHYSQAPSHCTLAHQYSSMIYDAWATIYHMQMDRTRTTLLHLSYFFQMICTEARLIVELLADWLTWFDTWHPRQLVTYRVHHYI